MLTETPTETFTRPKKSFLRSESGSLTILTLFLIVIVFLATGFAVDVMRFDRERAKLQYALDRAVLAAADLDQDLCPKEVVESFLRKDGLEDYLLKERIKVTPEICGSEAITIYGFRKVEAVAQMNVGTHFMKWSGVDSLNTVAKSVAEESINNVEISLAIDVSGSMRKYNRLANLKTAAKGFIDDMVEKVDDGKLSISIVPYATQAALPDYLMDQLNTYGVNRHANCINLSDDDLSSLSFDLAPIRPRTLHFTYDKDYHTRPSKGIVEKEVCGAGDDRKMTVLQKDPDILKASIDRLDPLGNTAHVYGMKWALTLLDPSFNPVIKNLAGSEIPAEFHERPYGYGTGRSMKVVVLFTDGISTGDYRINPPYRSGESILWWNEVMEVYSTYSETRNRYYWHGVDILEWDDVKKWYWARGEWQPTPYGNGDYTVIRCTSANSYNDSCSAYDYGNIEKRKVVDGDGNSTISENLVWPEVWEASTWRYIRDLFNEALGTTFANDFYDNSVTEIKGYKRKPRVMELCDSAKDKGVAIFTIAFETDEKAKELMKYCASDAGAYYEASGEEIEDVFASIGSSIRNLRLTH